MTTPISMPLPANADPLLYPLLAQLVDKHYFTRLSAADFDAFTQRPGRTLLMFLEDPVRYRETLDLAVIVPELVRAFPGRFAVGVLMPADARREARRYGFARWPAFVMLRDGHYVGAVDGIRDWDVYVGELDRLLAAEPTRPPTVGIPVLAAGAADSPSCQ
jgi:hydrogenase-1 operon protein HyaE